jgi:hypothetical protein
MSAPTRIATFTTVFAVGLAALASGAGEKITASGTTHVKLGMTYQQLRNAGRVGKINHGCELAGPNARGALLNPPLKGSVDLSFSSPRKIKTITISGGATARGVGIGDKLADIKAAYPKAQVDHSTEEVFAITLVKIPKSGGGKLQFAVDTGSKKISLIGIPNIAFCE